VGELVVIKRVDAYSVRNRFCFYAVNLSVCFSCVQDYVSDFVVDVVSYEVRSKSVQYLALIDLEFFNVVDE
jgi:hypothetical protein